MEALKLKLSIMSIVPQAKFDILCHELNTNQCVLQCVLFF